MKVQLSSSAGTKARNTRLQFQKLAKAGSKVERWKSLIKPTPFNGE